LYLVRPIWAVADIVIDARNGNLDIGVVYACEGIDGFVIFRDCGVTYEPRTSKEDI